MTQCCAVMVSFNDSAPDFLQALPGIALTMFHKDVAAGPKNTLLPTMT